MPLDMTIQKPIINIEDQEQQENKLPFPSNQLVTPFSSEEVKQQVENITSNSSDSEMSDVDISKTHPLSGLPSKRPVKEQKKPNIPSYQPTQLINANLTREQPTNLVYNSQQKANNTVEQASNGKLENEA